MKQLKRILSALVVLAIAWFSRAYLQTPSTEEGGGTAVAEAPVEAAPRSVEERAPTAQASEIARLFEEQRSDVMVEVEAEVIKLLRDDNEGSRHQKFLLEIEEGLTVLIAHNIDLAPRVPVSEGETVEVYGEYEWNHKGGVIHWTHKDPANRHEHGFILHRGKKYW